ncbi:hypothetical protein D6D54_00875 [Spiroplasma poulsonii]|uniref:Uncharacterized protein n=1 Tax=Spiroplasma poulsonii TaxID=2138 RepID=A0A433ET24_9MOLU|nr:hypothetical protein [Spiroplasma poulsonii]MBW3057807.1 hypothetical protein [Spiroplasma poulsonii]RUP78060.1 hypothetical protein D6D54_00875 [Spiroplasma poulsonii]
MVEKNKTKKWLWYKIVNLVILIILIILTIAFTVMFVIDQKAYTVVFLMSVLLLGIWVTGYFMGHFLFMNRENIKDGTRKLFDDYRKKDKNKNKESKAEKIKRLEKELADLKEEEED